MKLKYAITACGICFSCTLSSFALVSCDDDKIVEQPSENPEESEKPVDPKFQETCKVIMDRIKAAMMETNIQKANENAAKWMAGISESGAWSDIDYSDTSLEFNPEQHIDRLKQLAQAYVLEGCDYFGKPEVSKAVANGLQYWITLAPKCTNWWNNQISVPQTIGEILILMRYGAEPVPAELESSIFDYLIETAGDPAEQTGANKTDVALHWLYRGLLQEDPEVVDAAVYHTFIPLSYVEPREEGIQYDNGYFQHGPQTYIGGYAPVMISGVLRVANYTKDTDYQINANQMAPFRSFITQTYAPSFRDHVQFFNLVGRSVSRPGSLKNNGIVSGVLEPLKAIDPDHASEYDECISYSDNNYSGVKERFTNYYIGDWALYFGRKYSTSVRLTSTRTRKIEHGNNENLRCFFMSEGSMDLAVKGGEYFNIFPAWNWSFVPGVTCPDMGNDVPLPGGWGEPGEGNFSGGLSAGKDGFCGFKMLITKYDVDLSGNKSYFFMDDAIVCLGSGINSKMAKGIHTTLDQSLFDGSATYSVDGSVQTVSLGANATDAGIDWFWYNDRGYFFPEKQKVSFKLAEQSGAWKDINAGKTGSVTANVCTLWLSHGLLPKDATYSYVIVPGITQGEMAGYNVVNFKIVVNQPEVQAVQSVSGKKIQAMFYAAGSIETEDGLKITVDQPCAVMLQETGADTYNLYFADPAHKLSRLTVAVEKGNKKAQYTYGQFAADNVYKGKTHQTVLTLAE